MCPSAGKVYVKVFLDDELVFESTNKQGGGGGGDSGGYKWRESFFQRAFVAPRLVDDDMGGAGEEPRFPLLRFECHEAHQFK